MRRILTCLAIAVIACIVLGVIAMVVAGPAITNIFNSTTALVDTSTKFMTALKDQNYDQAYAFISSDQKTSFGGSADGLKQLVETNGWNKPTSWNFTSFNMNNNEGVVSGDVTFSGDSNKKTLQIVLHKASDSWNVAGLSIK